MTNPANPGTPPGPPPGTPGAPISPMPPSGGMPKWLIILLVVLLVVVLGCCGGLTMCHFMCNSAAKTGAGAMQSFVEQRTGMSVDTSGTGLSLPADFPKDIPVAAGYKVKAKITPPGTKGGLISLTGSSSLKALSDFYSTELPKQGWKQVSDSADTDSITQMYSKATDKRTVMIMGTNKGTELQITYSSE